MFARRSLLRLASSGVIVATVSRGMLEAAEPSEEELAAKGFNAAAQAAVERGLVWLARRQEKEGSFGNGYGRNTAVCALAGMAFLAGGDTPLRGKYGRALDRVTAFLLKNRRENGFISHAPSASHGPMYDHGFAVLFLAEVYGMSRRDDVREGLEKAVRLIVSAQNHEGGWRYEPVPREADLSVTVCQIMALRAARNAGIYVPNDTVEKCVEYVKRSQNADGGFMYMSIGGESRFPRSAAGVTALYSAGVYDGVEIRRGLEYLARHAPSEDEPFRDTHYMYGHYYAAQAMWHAGGERWRTWYAAIRDALLPRQQRDGSWQDAVATEYGTAMACIILQLPNNLLPIFQR